MKHGRDGKLARQKVAYKGLVKTLGNTTDPKRLERINKEKELLESFGAHR